MMETSPRTVRLSLKTQRQYPSIRSKIDQLQINAAAEDAGTGEIIESLALLRDTELLSDDGTADPTRTARELMYLGAGNLSLGRLVEGHMNALYLVNIHGAPDLQRRVRGLVSSGAFLGVWGADDRIPVTMDEASGYLRGGKAFASGLGVVTHAVVSVGGGAEARLALVDVKDRTRQDAARWQMPGMKATASGAFDFDGLTVSARDWIGAPGDYFTEPHFVGGVWRIAALQIGAALGLIQNAVSDLLARGRMGAEAQKTRLGQVAIRAASGVALVEKAARRAVEADPETAVSLSISARLLTEDIALDAIRSTEQSLGLAHFASGSATERMARDLSVYLRQAARDALLTRMADHAFCDGGSVWRLVE